MHGVRGEAEEAQMEEVEVVEQASGRLHGEAEGHRAEQQPHIPVEDTTPLKTSSFRMAEFF